MATHRSVGFSPNHLRTRVSPIEVFPDESFSLNLFIHFDRDVLIDEATSCLDAGTEFQMSDFMDGEFAGATVLLVAQRLQCFETADVVLMMREGRVDSILRQDEDTGEWYEDFEREEGGRDSAGVKLIIS